MLKEGDNRLHLVASCIPNDTHHQIFIKTFNLVNMCGGDMGTDGHKIASKKQVSTILQSVLKHHKHTSLAMQKKISKPNLE